jgi:hypothetical protein
VPAYLVRIWVPDRPGALGQVATSIGVVGGDVVGIDILDRGAGKAIDELVVTLEQANHLDRMIASISAINGVDIEEVRPLEGRWEQPTLVVLSAATRIVEADAGKRLDVLCREAMILLEAGWAAAVSLDSPTLLVEVGEAPSAEWLVAFVAGSRHLTVADALTSAPTDLAWAIEETANMAIAVGGRRSAFRSREREELILLAQIAAAGP